ncbi:hypothetical protein JOM56_007488 [Amanita muscaria]
MTARTLQPSELQIQREVEALRDLRRRSSTPGALTIDPDLPPNQSPPSPSQIYWSNNSQARSSEDGDSSSSSHEGSSIPRRRSSRSAGSDSGDAPTNTDDPFHLFWVPASIHPEIAPAEFRAFLKEHARAPPPSDDIVSPSVSSVSSYSSASNLARRKSMLSRQYQPSEDDGVEDEKVLPFRRSRGNLHPNQGPQLTISDLQKLEQLAEEASRTDDPSKFRNILRRSLSLNVSPSAIPNEEIPDLGDEADVPIIVPPPGQILRRAARTKIRKPSLTGDGGGHRFKATRRTLVRAATAPVEPRTSSDRSSSEHGGESLESVPEYIPIPHDNVIQPRPDSYSDETLIIDAYARDEEEEAVPQKATSPEPLIIDSIISSSIPPQLPFPDVDSALFEAFEPALFQSEPQPVSAQSPESQSQQEPLEPVDIPLPTSPPNAVTPPVAPLDPSLISDQAPEQHPEPPQQPPPQPSAPIPVATDTQPPQQRKEKDKKGGLFGKWSSDKTSKKLQKNGSSEKETGFFSSLFGGSKKKQDAEPVSSTAGREAAQALLGMSKSKNNSPHSAPGFPPGMAPNNYSRYPIHVERAIYRLSHIKLANPRRPLYEQVLISNLMFWYLGVINKAQPPAQASGQPIVAVGVSVSGAHSNDAEREQREREQREKAEKEKERLEREQRERETEAKKKESGKRGSLTKASAVGSPGGGRRAEMPVKGPQYEMQHRVMEQEYGYAGQGSQGTSPGRITAPGSPGPPQPERQRSSKSPSPPRMNSTSPTPSGRRSQSPPAQNSQRLRYSPNSSQENLVAPAPNGRLPGRSLSTTAVPSPPMYQVNGRARKGVSAYVAIPSGTKRPRSSEGRTDENGFEEEDVPLAVWQQQRKR